MLKPMHDGGYLKTVFGSKVVFDFAGCQGRQQLPWDIPYVLTSLVGFILTAVFDI